MLSRISLSLLLIAALPAWPQAAPSATGFGGNTGDESPMQTPPPVSGRAYAVTPGTEGPSNYLSAGVVVNAGYSNNVLPGSGSVPISDTTYSVGPTLDFAKTTARSQSMLIYSPSFTIYQHTSELNQQSQNLSFDSQYWLSPHTTVSVWDNFLKSSNILNQSNPLSGIEVSGSAQTPLVPIVAPFVDQTSNIASVELTHQYSRNDMVGGSGTFGFFNYPNSDETQQLYNSNSRGGAAFYSHRLAAGEYCGATYRFFEDLDTPTTSANQTHGETKVNSFLFFYTLYLKSTLSFSVMGGPEHYDFSAPPAPPSAAWTKALAASVAWRGSRTSLAAGYSLQINAGGGLIGAFRANNADIEGRWRMARNWGAGLGVGYSNTTNVSPTVALGYPGGNFASGAVTLNHKLSDHLMVEVGYTHLYQNYGGLAATSNSPNVNREYVSVSYQFVKALGR